MQAGVLAVPKWQVVIDDVNAVRLQDRSQLVNTTLVGPDAAANDQRLCVQPDRIAAFDGARLHDLPDDGNTERLQRLLVQRRFRLAQRFAHVEDHRPGMGDD